MEQIKGTNGKRIGDEFAQRMRLEIDSGRISVGTLLPSVRDLARSHDLDAKTTWRALKRLEVEGLVKAEPSRGFRVLRPPEQVSTAVRIAYLLGDGLESPDMLTGQQGVLLSAFRKTVADAGGTMLALASTEDPGRVLREIHGLRAVGAVTDSLDPNLTQALKRAEIPFVTVDMLLPDHDRDSVVQDGHAGGVLAATYLLDRGCKRIKWFGRMSRNFHALDRLGGFCAVLSAERGALPAETFCRTELATCEAAALKLLSSKNRPDGIAALWCQDALALAKASARLGLKIGKDFEMVGWSLLEAYETYAMAFPDGATPPTVVWSAREMAENAVGRLLQRTGNPNERPVTIRIPCRLKVGNP